MDALMVFVRAGLVGLLVVAMAGPWVGGTAVCSVVCSAACSAGSTDDVRDDGKVASWDTSSAVVMAAMRDR